ncbi:MAG TPA: helix-turn-helix transcriptional regulator [bacterium]|nr:helix-turn-helix transcriptional regulator [bacterium]
MGIIINLDVMLAKRKMKSCELAARVGITEQNLSVLKTGKARAVRLTTLDAICRALACQPGDLLEYRPDAAAPPAGD